MILHISRCANNVIILKYVIFIIETGKIDMAVCCCCFFGRTYVPRTQTERVMPPVADTLLSQSITITGTRCICLLHF